MSEKILSRKQVYEGRIMRVEVRAIELAGGRRSTRELICHPGAVVVLAERPDGCFVLVRQYRAAVEAELLEMIAGTLEPGEPPEEAARRETEEESGYRVESLRPLGVIIPCPGYSSEKLHCFHARVGQHPGASRPDFDESVAGVVMTRAEIEEAIAGGRLQDAKSIAIWHLGRQGAAAP
jgi:ADP-ribose pyrophosphatase